MVILTWLLVTVRITGLRWGSVLFSSRSVVLSSRSKESRPEALKAPGGWGWLMLDRMKVRPLTALSTSSGGSPVLLGSTVASSWSRARAWGWVVWLEEVTLKSTILPGLPDSLKIKYLVTIKIKQFSVLPSEPEKLDESVEDPVRLKSRPRWETSPFKTG